MSFFTFYWSASIFECRSLSVIDHHLQAEARSIYSIECWIFNWQVEFHKIVSASSKDCFDDKQHTECLNQIWSSIFKSYYRSIKAFYRHQTSFYHFFRYHNSKLKRCIIFNIIYFIQRYWDEHAHEVNNQQQWFCCWSSSFEEACWDMQICLCYVCSSSKY